MGVVHCLLNMNSALCLICLVFVQAHAQYRSGQLSMPGEHPGLEKGRYMLVEIDDEHLDKIADGQGGSSSSSSSSEEDDVLPTIPGTVIGIRRRPAHGRIFRRPVHRPRPMMYHGMPMRPHPMIAWKPIITWHRPMWMHRPILKRPMMSRPFGGPFRPMGGPQRAIRPAGPGFRPATQDTSEKDLDFDQYLDDEDDSGDDGNKFDINIFNSRRNMLQKGKF